MLNYLSPSKDIAKRFMATLRLRLFIGKMRYFATGVIIFLIGIPVAVYGWYHSQAAPAANIMTTQTSQKSPTLTSPPPVQATAPDTNIDVQANSQGTGQNVKTKLKVNNQQITVPDNGSAHQTIQSSGGPTSVDISLNTSSNGAASNHSSTNIQLNSTSDSQASVNNSE